jgi:hypothetical protein
VAPSKAISQVFVAEQDGEAIGGVPEEEKGGLAGDGWSLFQLLSGGAYEVGVY